MSDRGRPRGTTVHVPQGFHHDKTFAMMDADDDDSEHGYNDDRDRDGDRDDSDYDDDDVNPIRTYEYIIVNSDDSDYNNDWSLSPATDLV